MDFSEGMGLFGAPEALEETVNFFATGNDDAAKGNEAVNEVDFLADNAFVGLDENKPAGEPAGETPSVLAPASVVAVCGEQADQSLGAAQSLVVPVEPPVADPAVVANVPGLFGAPNAAAANEESNAVAAAVADVTVAPIGLGGTIEATPENMLNFGAIPETKDALAKPELAAGVPAESAPAPMDVDMGAGASVAPMAAVPEAQKVEPAVDVPPAVTEAKSETVVDQKPEVEMTEAGIAAPAANTVLPPAAKEDTKDETSKEAGDSQAGATAVKPADAESKPVATPEAAKEPAKKPEEPAVKVPEEKPSEPAPVETREAAEPPKVEKPAGELAAAEPAKAATDSAEKPAAPAAKAPSPGPAIVKSTSNGSVGKAKSPPLVTQGKRDKSTTPVAPPPANASAVDAVKRTPEPEDKNKAKDKPKSAPTVVKNLNGDKDKRKEEKKEKVFDLKKEVKKTDLNVKKNEVVEKNLNKFPKKSQELTEAEIAKKEAAAKAAAKAAAEEAAAKAAAKEKAAREEQARLEEERKRKAREAKLIKSGSFVRVIAAEDNQWVDNCYHRTGVVVKMLSEPDDKEGLVEILLHAYTPEETDGMRKVFYRQKNLQLLVNHQEVYEEVQRVKNRVKLGRCAWFVKKSKKDYPDYSTENRFLHERVRRRKRMYPSRASHPLTVLPPLNFLRGWCMVHVPAIPCVDDTDGIDESRLLDNEEDASEAEETRAEEEEKVDEESYRGHRKGKRKEKKRPGSGQSHKRAKRASKEEEDVDEDDEQEEEKKEEKEASPEPDDDADDDADSGRGGRRRRGRRQGGGTKEETPSKDRDGGRNRGRSTRGSRFIEEEDGADDDGDKTDQEDDKAKETEKPKEQTTPQGKGRLTITLKKKPQPSKEEDASVDAEADDLDERKRTRNKEGRRKRGREEIELEDAEDQRSRSRDRSGKRSRHSRGGRSEEDDFPSHDPSPSPPNSEEEERRRSTRPATRPRRR